MTVIRYWLPLLAIAAAVSVGCESAEDKARAALSQRLRQETRLTQPEIVQLFGQIGRPLPGRPCRCSRVP